VAMMGFFLFATASRPVLRPTQHSIHWVLGALSLLEHEGDHSLSSSTKVKNVRGYTSTPPIHLHGSVLN